MATQSDYICIGFRIALATGGEINTLFLKSRSCYQRAWHMGHSVLMVPTPQHFTSSMLRHKLHAHAHTPPLLHTGHNNIGSFLIQGVGVVLVDYSCECLSTSITLCLKTSTFKG